MGFSFRNQLWAGNIYHQLESICQDVDGFVNKNAVKFVGNQVQSVGMTVKRLYSDVVQDVLPFSGDTVKPEQQLAAGEQVDTHDPVSVTDIRTTSTSADDMQLAKNQASDDQEMRISKPADVEEVQNFQYLRDPGNARFHNSKDNTSAEQNVTDLEPSAANSSFVSEAYSSKCDDEICSSPASSAHEEVSTSIMKERRDFNHKKGDEGFSDETVCLFDAPSIASLSKREIRIVEDQFSDFNGSLSSPEVAISTHNVNQENGPMMDSPQPLACDVDDWSWGEHSAFSESCSTENESVDSSTSIQPSEHVFAYLSCNENEEITAIMPSTSFTSPKSSIPVESTSKDLSKEAENILHCRSLSDGCTYNVSAASSISNADKNKEVNVAPAFLIMESDDKNALQSNRSEFLFSSFESGHEEHQMDSHSAHSRIVISPSESANTYALGVPIGDLDLEAVELSPNLKHYGRSIVFNSNLVLPGSYRRRNFRYYKKLIQGVLTSRKRLSKEYEHLGIMYGDINVESDRHFERSFLSSFPNVALHAAETQSSQETGESEWELL